MKLSTRALLTTSIKILKNISKLYGFFPFVFNPLKNRFIHGSKRMKILSKGIVICQLVFILLTILLDPSIGHGVHNLHKTKEALVYISNIAYYWEILVIILSFWLPRCQILKTLNKVQKLYKQHLIVENPITLPRNFIFQFYFKIFFDVSSALFVSSVIMYFIHSVLKTIHLFVCFLFTLIIDTLVSNVLFLSFCYFGHLTHMVEENMKDDGLLINCRNCRIKQIDFCSKFHWMILDAVRNVEKVIQHSALWVMLSSFLGQVWAVCHF